MQLVARSEAAQLEGQIFTQSLIDVQCSSTHLILAFDFCSASFLIFHLSILVRVFVSTSIHLQHASPSPNHKWFKNLSFQAFDVHTSQDMILSIPLRLQTPHV
jgi:hypothetical protein